MNLPNIPLEVAKDIEQNVSYEDMPTPADLLNYMARMLSVDPNKLNNLQDVEVTSVQPDSADKIWIKTNEPVGIGLPIGGSYQMIYKYPANSPFLLKGSVPSVLRKLTSDEISDYGLTAPTASNINWVILSV